MTSFCCSVALRGVAKATRTVAAQSRTVFSSSAVSSVPSQNKKKSRDTAYAFAAISAMSALSIYSRYIRHEKVSTLILAEDSGILSRNDSTSCNEGTSHSCAKYDILSIIETIQRAGLMGSTKSVKEELDLLRKYHIERGFHGGLIVRDLSQPLFSFHADDDADVSSESYKNLAQRECYYLYYEIKANGHTKQQMFCRGTTLLVDVITCLMSWYSFDEELGCHIHHGFNKQADRVVEDVLPLLALPSDSSTVEVAGHSLGGAVAILVAVKLKRRGYHVTNVTTVAGPRLCRGPDDRDILESHLPNQTIRIENDLDIVPYIPPYGVSAGDKLWLVSDKGRAKAFMLLKEWIDDPTNSWTESVLLNLKLFESIWNQSNTHRIATHVTKLKNLADDIKAKYSD